MFLEKEFQLGSDPSEVMGKFEKALLNAQTRDNMFLNVMGSLCQRWIVLLLQKSKSGGAWEIDAKNDISYILDKCTKSSYPINKQLLIAAAAECSQAIQNLFNE